MKKRFPLFIGLLACTATLPKQGRLLAQDYPIVPAPFTSVKITGGFWAPRLETNRRVTLPFDFKKCEETGRIDNFAIAGGLKAGTFRGIRYDDSDVFKVMEGAAYSLQTHPDPALDRYLDSLITLVAAAQEPDGYLYTIRSILKDSTFRRDRGAGPTRYSYEAHSHELYNVGHMYEAAVAHFQATGKRNFLNVAIKNADHLTRVIGPGAGQLVVVPGHEETELGLLKLYRVTGEKRYVDLARFFVEMRGRADKRKLYDEFGNMGPAYFQDHKPVAEQTEAVGHAVRAGYLYAAVTDLAALDKDTTYLSAMKRIWTDVVERKQYLTGGLGAKENGEAFGQPYELPNDEAYAETCAAVANLLWNHRLFLLTGDAKYMDVFERVLYNGFLAGVSLGGDEFFYVNPLASNGRRKFNSGISATRAPWFRTSCCPTNVVRFLPSLPGYVYASRGRDLFVNLFLDNTSDVDVAGQPVRISQQTRYPWDGAVQFTISPRRARAFALRLRLPGWAQNQPLPSSLYAYADKQNTTYQLTVNGKPARATLEDGFLVINRTWKPGDNVQFTLPMPVRNVVADARVEDNRNRFAVERGPVVFCAEGADNDGQALNVSPNGPLTPRFQPALLGGVMTLTGKQFSGANDTYQAKPLTLIPYYAWAHRGAGEMAVWFGVPKR